MDKSREERDAREAKADIAVDLVIDAVTAFLRGDAAFTVHEGNAPGVKIVTFGSIATKKE